ncbi:MAG: hypothetical protein ABIL15_06445 [candidate division WOR-3 bacterium]
MRQIVLIGILVLLSAWSIFFISKIFALNNIGDIFFQFNSTFEESSRQVTDELFDPLDSLSGIENIKDNPFALVIFLIEHFSQFEKKGVKDSYLTINEILTKKVSNQKSGAIATVAIVQNLGWDIQLFYNERECYLGLNLSDDWKIRKGTWIEKDRRRYYLKEFDTRTPLGKLRYDNPASVYQSLRIDNTNLKPFPLIKSIPHFSRSPVHTKRLKWLFKNSVYQLTISIPAEQAEWTMNLPPSLYGMVSCGIEELKNLGIIDKLKFLVSNFDEFDRVNFLLKFCQSESIFSYDNSLPIKSITNQLIDGKNDCDGRSVFLYCLLWSVLDYPDSNIVFLSWPNHVALGLKPRTDSALAILMEKGFYIGDNYFILDPAYLGDTHWGSKMDRLSDDCEIIKIATPLR